MRRWALIAVASVGVVDAVADVDVRQASEGKVTVQAKGAPLSEILDRLGRVTGMKVVYDGPPPRQSVTLTLQDRTPAEAVLTLLDGLGLNYGMLMDKTGTRVQQLLMAGSVPVTGSRASAPAVRMPVAPPPPPEDADEPVEPPPDEPPDVGGEEVPVAPPPAPGAVPGVPGIPAAPGQDVPFMPGPPGVPSGQPTPSPGLLGPGIRPLTLPTPPPPEEGVPTPTPSQRPPS